MKSINDFINNLTGISHETQHKIWVTFVIILVLLALRIIVLRLVWRNTEDVKVRYQWKRVLSFVIPFFGVMMTTLVWVSAIEQFGAFLGLMTAGVAIALKDPLTNLTGWFFILFRKPFVVGDRVQVGNHSGDIIDIRLFQFTMLEIGNWVDADQSTGRIIHIPNGRVFVEPQANYSSGFEYIWNEIPVIVTFESDWQKAKSILEEIIFAATSNVESLAKEQLKEATKNYMIYYNKLTPIVYTSVKDNGVCLTMRYLCNPRGRRGSVDKIWQNVLTQFAINNISFAYPTTRFFQAKD